jgi:hypothetical protein
MTIKKIMKGNSVREVVEKRELLHTIDGTKNEHCHYGKHMEVLEKIKVELQYDPAPPLLDISKGN